MRKTRGHSSQATEACGMQDPGPHWIHSQRAGMHPFFLVTWGHILRGSEPQNATAVTSLQRKALSEAYGQQGRLPLFPTAHAMMAWNRKGDAEREDSVSLLNV